MMIIYFAGERDEKLLIDWGIRNRLFSYYYHGSDGLKENDDFLVRLKFNNSQAINQSQKNKKDY